MSPRWRLRESPQEAQSCHCDWPHFLFNVDKLRIFGGGIKTFSTISFTHRNESFHCHLLTDFLPTSCRNVLLLQFVTGSTKRSTDSWVDFVWSWEVLLDESLTKLIQRLHQFQITKKKSADPVFLSTLGTNDRSGMSWKRSFVVSISSSAADW